MVSLFAPSAPTEGTNGKCVGKGVQTTFNMIIKAFGIGIIASKTSLKTALQMRGFNLCKFQC